MKHADRNVVVTAYLDSSLAKCIGRAAFVHQSLDVGMGYHIVQSIGTEHVSVARTDIGCKLIEIKVRTLATGTNAISDNIRMLLLSALVTQRMIG